MGPGCACVRAPRRGTPSGCNPDPVTPADATVTFVGHATVAIEMDGVRLITDPVLRHRVAHLRRAGRLHADSRAEVDAVLISHAHRDHLDLPSLRRLPRRGPVVVPRGLGRMMARAGIRDVVEVDVGDSVRVGAVEVRATPAEHDGARGLGQAVAPALGYAALGSRRVLFLGDTDLFPEMDGLVNDLDLALVPIWGWGSRLGKGRHLDPQRAAEAIARLRPRVAVPIHWGTLHPIHLGLLGTPAFVHRPAPEFVAHASGTAPQVDVRVLRPGEATTLATVRT